ncbi:glycohydrolase toxin TNT-related protein [Actinomadura viridis]|uniref:glycohydrolase toxin TNT-related protein n=1 Tax=Actinomadura viridis TaxID=58110 RepID=UPI00368A3268
MSLSREPGRVVTGPLESLVPAGLPQTEHDLIASLAGESPLMFPRARRALRNVTGDRAGRFLLGRVAPGCWSMVHGEPGWLVVRRQDEAPADGDRSDDEVVAFETARSAVADAMAGVMADAEVALTSGLLEVAGLLHRDTSDLRGMWSLGEAGQEIKERGSGPSGPRSHGLGLPLESFEGCRHGYFLRLPVTPPEAGPFAGVREIYELATRAMLPADADAEETEELPEGTVLDGHGSQDQEFLFTPETSFRRRGLRGGPRAYERRTYRVQRPLRVHPGFPVDKMLAPHPAEDRAQDHQDRGYYLVDSIAALVAWGALVEIDGADGR